MTDTQEATRAPLAPVGFWSLPRWLNEPLRLLQKALSLAASISGMALTIVAMPPAPAWLIPGCILGFLVIYLSVFVHELGHLMGARRGGMTVLRMRVGRLDLQARRRGWSVGWRPKADQRLSGFVLAFADPRGPWRQQHLRFVAGGPLANLLLAMLLGLSALWMAPGVVRGLFTALAACNACLGLANLLPVERKPLVSDGLWWLRWRRGIDTRHPALAFARLMGLACAGTCADEVPETDLLLLESQEQPMPLVAMYIRLKALLIQGRWQEAAALDPPFQAQRMALPELVQRPLYDILRLMNAELAFAEAMASRSAAGLLEDLLPIRLQREYASLWARCLALRAALAGDDQAVAQNLAHGLAHAACSPDLSLEKEEQRLQRHMLQSLRG